MDVLPRVLYQQQTQTRVATVEAAAAETGVLTMVAEAVAVPVALAAVQLTHICHQQELEVATVGYGLILVVIMLEAVAVI
jgi:hypothetical protein